jgi:hypothetical protein
VLAALAETRAPFAVRLALGIASLARSYALLTAVLDAIAVLEDVEVLSDILL